MPEYPGNARKPWLVHCGSQARVTAEKLGELSESGVQVVGEPQGVRRFQARVVCGCFIAACGGLGVLHVVPKSADTHLYLLIRPAVEAP